MQDQIQQDLKQAMLARDETAVSTLRMLLSELKYAQVKKGGELEDKDVVIVVQKELKKRKEAAEGFRNGGREEQAQKEESEAKVLEKYLPTQLSDEELTKVVEEAINNIGAQSISDIGRVIGQVMGKVGQSVDGSRVSAKVKEKLSK
jgi:uncharacterized protein